MCRADHIESHACGEYNTSNVIRTETEQKLGLMNMHTAEQLKLKTDVAAELNVVEPTADILEMKADILTMT